MAARVRRRGLALCPCWAPWPTPAVPAGQAWLVRRHAVLAVSAVATTPRARAAGITTNGPPARPTTTHRSRGSCGGAQCLPRGGTIGAWFLASSFARLSARFSFRDFPAFLDMCCRGDLSAIAAPCSGAWLTPCHHSTPAHPGDRPIDGLRIAGRYRQQRYRQQRIRARRGRVAALAGAGGEPGRNLARHVHRRCEDQHVQ